MTVLLAGLVLFLGVHSARIVADDARARFIAQRGEAVWKGLYTLVSAVGLALIVWGFGLARQQPIVLWTPPEWTRLAASLSDAGELRVAERGLRAAQRDQGPIAPPDDAGHGDLGAGPPAGQPHAGRRVAVRWLPGVGGVVLPRGARARSGGASDAHRQAPLSTTMVAVIVGALAWAVFGFWLHGWLIGVRPFG